MTRSELLEAMARGMLGDERYDALRPEIFSYIERKSLPEQEWASQLEVKFDMSRILEAIEQSGLAVVPVEPTVEMKDAACSIGPDTNCGQFDYDNASDVWSAMLQSGRLK